MRIAITYWMRCFSAAGMAAMVGSTSAQTETAVDSCGSLANAFGPLDYRTESRANLSLVEGAHFTPGVEALVKGNRGYLGSDIDYTLRAFPNHHRALVAAIRYGERQKADPPPHMTYSIECYLVRAIRFRSDDVVVRMLYAQYLDTHGRAPDAMSQLDHVAHAASDSAMTQYNLALLHFDAKRFDHALKHAHKAYALGIQRNELREKLKAIGQWRDAE